MLHLVAGYCGIERETERERESFGVGFDETHSIVFVSFASQPNINYLPTQVGNCSAYARNWNQPEILGSLATPGLFSHCRMNAWEDSLGSIWWMDAMQCPGHSAPTYCTRLPGPVSGLYRNQRTLEASSPCSS